MTLDKGIRYVSCNAPEELKDLLRRSGFAVSEVNPAPTVSTPVAAHPDINMCRLGISNDADVMKALPEELGSDYPADIPYNAACTGKYFIHNLRHTAPSLLEAAQLAGMSMIDVRQGYAKCSCVIVDEDSIITYDHGIASRCEKAGMNVLLVRAGGIDLEGYNTGFIGGTSGRVDDAVIFCGDIDSHPDAVQIREFIEKRGLKVIDFDFSLTDIGSII